METGRGLFGKLLCKSGFPGQPVFMSSDEEQKSAPAQPEAPGKLRRRSRRGGRRHSRRRGPRPAEGAAAETSAPDESAQPAAEEAEHREAPETTVAEKQKTPGITGAIDQVNSIIEELKHALDEMEEVLETLELAERQKIDDEREIQSLQRALRQLHQRPRESEPRH